MANYISKAATSKGVAGHYKSINLQPPHPTCFKSSASPSDASGFNFLSPSQSTSEISPWQQQIISSWDWINFWRQLMIILIFGPGQTMADTTTQTTSLISLFQTILSNILPEVQMLFPKVKLKFCPEGCQLRGWRPCGYDARKPIQGDTRWRWVKIQRRL